MSFPGNWIIFTGNFIQIGLVSDKNNVINIWRNNILDIISDLPTSFACNLDHPTTSYAAVILMVSNDFLYYIYLYQIL